MKPSKTYSPSPDMLYFPVLKHVLNRDLLLKVLRKITHPSTSIYAWFEDAFADYTGKASINLEQENAALAFAAFVAEDAASLTKSHLKIMEKHFSKSQINELCAYILFILRRSDDTDLKEIPALLTCMND